MATAGFSYFHDKLVVYQEDEGIKPSKWRRNISDCTWAVGLWSNWKWVIFYTEDILSCQIFLICAFQLKLLPDDTHLGVIFFTCWEDICITWLSTSQSAESVQSQSSVLAKKGLCLEQIKVQGTITVQSYLRVACVASMDFEWGDVIHCWHEPRVACVEVGDACLKSWKMFHLRQPISSLAMFP